MTHFIPNIAATVAVATPCWPAPVSAMIRILPMRLATRTWPMALLILCAPHHGADGSGHASDIDRQLDGRQVHQIHDSLGDIYRLIAHALEVGVDLGHRENEAQIRGCRLLRGEDVEGEFIDLALGRVDQALVLEDQAGAGEMAVGG